MHICSKDYLLFLSVFPGKEKAIFEIISKYSSIFRNLLLEEAGSTQGKKISES